MDEFDEAPSSMNCDVTMAQRAQVYSSFIESRGKKSTQADRQHQQRGDNASTTSAATSSSMCKRDKKAKKPKMATVGGQNQRCSTMMMANSSGSKHADDDGDDDDAQEELDDDEEGEEEEEEEAIENIDPMALAMASYLGIEHFDDEHVCVALADRDCILVHLNSSRKLNFCFKGKCSVWLVHGQVETSGFRLVGEQQQQPQARWYDLYSPETNSFASISNLATANASASTNEQAESELLVHQHVVDKLKLALGGFNAASEENLFRFLSDTRYSPALHHSSLLAIRPLHSPMCNYLSYFDNFQHVYHSPTNALRQQQQQQQQQHTPESRVITAFLERFGVYPIPAAHFNAVRVTSDEESHNVAQIISASVSKSPKRIYN